MRSLFLIAGRFMVLLTVLEPVKLAGSLYCHRSIIVGCFGFHRLPGFHNDFGLFCWFIVLKFLGSRSGRLSDRTGWTVGWSRHSLAFALQRSLDLWQDLE